MKKMANLFLTLKVILSLLLPTSMPAMAAKTNKTGEKCECIHVTERIKEQFLKEKNVTLLETEKIQFVGQYQLKKKNSKDFLEILKNNIPEKKRDMIQKASNEKKLIFLFEATDASKKIWIFRCNICGTIYLIPLPFNTGSINGGNSGSSTSNSSNNSSNSGSNTGNSGNNSSNNGNNSGNSGNNTGNTGNNTGNTGDNSGGERPEPEKPDIPTPKPEDPKPEKPDIPTPKPEDPKPEKPDIPTPKPEDPKPEKPDIPTPKPEDPKPEEPDIPTPDPEDPKPEEPSLKKIDTSGWKFENVSFVYDGNLHRPILTGVPEEIQDKLEFVWSTNGETDAGKHSTILSVKVPEGFEEIPDMQVEFTIEEAEFDPSQITWDETSFVCNGKEQAPNPVGLPADAIIVSSTEAKVNAGENYHHELEVKIPNYKEFTISTNYSITPVELTPQHQYNEETGEVTTVVEGIIDKEDVDKIVNFVNGSEQENIIIEAPGEYNVKTEITLDSSVKNNYTSAIGDLVAENNYLAKRTDSFYNITVEHIKNDDGTVQVKIYISDVRIPFDKDEDAITLAFDVSYDKNSLQYNYDGGGFETGSDDWFGDYNPDRDPDDEMEAEEHDVSMLFYGALSSEKTLVCTLGYQVIGNSENVEFSIINPELSSGMSEHEFSYTTDDEKIVINQTEDYVAPTEISVDWDLQKDSQYQGVDEDEEEAAREALQEYLDEEFSKDNTSVSSVLLEQEEISEGQQEDSFSKDASSEQENSSEFDQEVDSSFELEVQKEDIASNKESQKDEQLSDEEASKEDKEEQKEQTSAPKQEEEKEAQPSESQPEEKQKEEEPEEER